MKLPTVKTRRCVKYVDSEGKSLRERISVERGIDGKSVIRMKSLYMLCWMYINGLWSHCAKM